MARLRRPDSFEDLRGQGLFRAVSASQLLAGQAAILEYGLVGVMGGAGMAYARIPTREQVQEAGRILFDATAEVEQVDVFISHTWGSGRWAKFLGLCLYLNLGRAIKTSLAVWILAIGTLIAVGGLQGYGGSRLLFPVLVCLPAAIFFWVLLRGHFTPCEVSSTSLWLDKLCIHQTDEELKQRQLAALPIFVARSSRMLVLWDEMYFERLWCHVELATFAKHGDQHKLDFQPLWLAPWLVTCLTLELLSAIVAELCVLVSPTTSNTGELKEFFEGFFADPRTVTFWIYCSLWLASSAIIYLPIMIPCFLSCQRKLQQHQVMLHQIATFDIKDAKCSLAEDRLLLEQQVQELFCTHGMEAEAETATIQVDEPEPDSSAHRAEEWEPVTHAVVPRGVHGDALHRFNAYVRGPLHDAVLEQMGSELYIPWHICMAALLPDVLYSAVNILGCDNGTCQTSAAEAGFASVEGYMATQLLAWILCLMLSIPISYPALLHMIQLAMKIGAGPLQSLVAMLCCPLAYAYSNACSGVIWGCLYCLALDYSQAWLTGFLLFLALLTLHFWLLFLRQEGQERSAASCRCVRRQVNTLPRVSEHTSLL
ncbi:unnamed protein product [Symbiodinium natans]|uniref:Uncharacterized protein n=1 Tax=Symbiodinium natans TaxID=878477 RepID=A0A812T4C4_9DINO|nr:unnamed protein product [Symbiodinium natans]